MRKREVLTGIDTIAPIRRGVATTAPQAANPQYFNPSKEWILYPIDFFDSLGSHDCGCLTLGTQELENSVSVYPNPVNDILMVTAHAKIAKVSLMDLKGMRVSLPVSIGVSGKNAKISTETLNSGIWILQIQLENGVTLTRKIQK